MKIQILQERSIRQRKIEKVRDVCIGAYCQSGGDTAHSSKRTRISEKRIIGVEEGVNVLGLNSVLVFIAETWQSKGRVDYSQAVKLLACFT
jgi:hypothetical protein